LEEVYRLGYEEERDKRREEWLKWCIENTGEITKRLMELTGETEEETNDVYIYKTLRYPPGSKLPTAN
jgi:hypothetical protein